MKLPETYLKVVVALEVRTRLQLRGVQLKGLRARVTVCEKEDISLQLFGQYVGCVCQDVPHSDLPKLYNLFGSEYPDKNEINVTFT